MKTLKIALCGNPNVGKSTVFNALTGLKQHTGNWAGKTVDVARGFVVKNDTRWEITDLPGAYSLLNGSAEEIVASDYLTFQHPDAVIVVCDALSLERNLNLALQIAQSCPRTVLCINMMDEALKAGIAIDCKKLETLLQIPVIGISARRKIGLDSLLKRTAETVQSAVSRRETLVIPQEIKNAVQIMLDCLKETAPELCKSGNGRLAALRAFISDDSYIEKLATYSAEKERLYETVKTVRTDLLKAGYSKESIAGTLIAESYHQARLLCQAAVCENKTKVKHSFTFDQLFCRRWFALLIGTVLLGGVLFLTILGANVPSAWLSEQLNRLGELLYTFLQWISTPAWLTDLLVNGIYRVTAWVVSVMLPPMAIFFPLFTLLEDMGLLPRIAFHLDHCFQKCHSCGKQALCMCMGLGCNAVGVSGCRIIQSPRERMIAILTNALVPCNGRFPALIALISMFFAFGSGVVHSLSSTFFLLGSLLLSLLVTFLCSWLLSRTILSGMTSAFALELPPYRQPKWGEVLIRSLLDRTLFVLGRAVAVAAPAGLVVWCLSHLYVNDVSVLQYLSLILNPAGRLLGLDGAILLAFILSFPANELVLPMILMIYQEHSVLMELQGFETVRQILMQNGWTLWTAAAVAVFLLFHWPCSTTVLTIRKETRSFRWTFLGIILPACVGVSMCLFLRFISLLPF